MNETVNMFGFAIPVWQYFSGVVLLAFTWDKIPALFSQLFKLVPSAAKFLGGLLHSGTTEQALDKSLDTALDALQALTLWGVKNASPALLKKITDLYTELKKVIHENDGLDHKVEVE